MHSHTNPSYRFLKNFSLISQINAQEAAQSNFRGNKIKKMKKKVPLNLPPGKDLPAKCKNLWYVKQHNNYVDANTEVVAQEFFRLFIAGHTKTRLLKHVSYFYAASKGVLFFCSLDKLGGAKTKIGLDNGSYTGLGHVLLIAMLVNEIDLKSAHLLLDTRHKIAKIDGDRCFAELDDYPECREYNFSFSSEDIDALPQLKTYQSHNWLDHIENGKSKSPSVITHSDLSSNPKFREEVNQAILRVLLVPKVLIKEFIQFYFSDEKFKTEANALEALMLNRIDMLRTAAFANASFMAYVHTDKAKTEVNDYLSYLENFNMVGKEKLDVARYRADILFRLAFLRSGKTPVEPEPTIPMQEAKEVKPSSGSRQLYSRK